MLRGLTAKQFTEWEHFAQLEPFDETRQDYRIASIVTMLANINRDPKKKGYELSDFVLKFDEVPPKKKQTWAEQEMILKVIAAGFRAAKKTP
jgi:hypothetical protein